MTRTPLPQGAAKRAEVEAMFDRIAPRYDQVNRIISLGLAAGWRRRTIEALGLAAGAAVLDLGCGTGDLCRELTAAGLRPVGVDVSAGMLALASTDGPLVRGDGMELPVATRSVDGIVSGFALRNLVDLDVFAAECARVLRPAGRLALLDTAEPPNRLARAGHQLWFHRVVPWLGDRLGRDRAAYDYLPRSAAYLPAGPELVAKLGRAGFADVARRLVGGGAAQLLTGTRR